MDWPQTVRLSDMGQAIGRLDMATMAPSHGRWLSCWASDPAPVDLAAGGSVEAASEGRAARIVSPLFFLCGDGERCPRQARRGSDVEMS